MIPDVETFNSLVDGWIKEMTDKVVEVTVPKPNGVNGQALKQLKPYPALIENFMLYANIYEKEWFKMLDNPQYAEYQNRAQRVASFCNSSILNMMALGYISDNMGKFYLVNNSRYKDVSEIVQTNVTKVLPAWATAKIQIEEANKPKALPHESIPFTEIVTPVKSSIDDLL